MTINPPKTRVVLFGSRPLGAFALRLMLETPSVDVVGCVSRKPPENAWWNDDPYVIEDVPRLDYDDLGRVDFDLGVSVNFWKRITSDLIGKPSLGIVNVHHSYMLSLRGRDMTTYAILNARKQDSWLHGTTLHYVDDDLDTGPIIASESVSIAEDDTAWSLFAKTEAAARDMLTTWLPRVSTSRVPAVASAAGQPVNLRQALPSKQVGDLSDPLAAYDIVRAFEFSGYFEPAYVMRNGEKVHLTISSVLGGAKLADAGEGRAIYENRSWEAGKSHSS